LLDYQQPIMLGKHKKLLLPLLGVWPLAKTTWDSLPSQRPSEMLMRSADPAGSGVEWAY